MDYAGRTASTASPSRQAIWTMKKRSADSLSTPRQGQRGPRTARCGRRVEDGESVERLSRHPRTVATSTILAAGGTDDGGSPRGQSWPVLPRRNGHIPKVAALLGETTAPPVGPMAAIWKLTGSSLGNPELIVPASPPGPLHLEDANLPALSVGVQIEDVGLTRLRWR